uniref:Uncharacterized protein n=1 Tax=Romanomermis culicivorax TaxID=13658 RepID=A0A915IL69_ROMCU
MKIVSKTDYKKNTFVTANREMTVEGLLYRIFYHLNIESTQKKQIYEQVLCICVNVENAIMHFQIQSLNSLSSFKAKIVNGVSAFG